MASCNVFILTDTSELSQYLPEDFKTSWMKETKLNDNEQKM